MLYHTYEMSSNQVNISNSSTVVTQLSNIYAANFSAASQKHLRKRSGAFPRDGGKMPIKI